VRLKEEVGSFHFRFTRLKSCGALGHRFLELCYGFGVLGLQSVAESKFNLNFFT
jgi:hypothetical protein